jgi:hypothetical protein
MFAYICTTFYGFERVCEEEIRAKLRPVSTRVLPQKVIFSSDTLPTKVNVLRSTQRICSYVAGTNPQSFPRRLLSRVVVYFDVDALYVVSRLW